MARAEDRGRHDRRSAQCEAHTSDEIRKKFWGGQIDAVLEEIARDALICGVRILDPGVIERVLHNDESVCTKKNPIAFRKLRELLMLGFATQEKSFEKLGVGETGAAVAEMRAYLTERYGGKLGGTPT